MHESVIARKYALALFNAARKQGALDEVEKDVESILRLNSQDGRLLRYLESPRELTAAKQELMDRAFKGRLHEFTLGFMHLVLWKKRAGLYVPIFQEFAGLVRRHRGILQVRVRSAVELAPPQIERLAAGVARLTGMKPELECRVDPVILGGVVITYEDRIIDRSVRRGLDDLREDLMKVRVL